MLDAKGTRVCAVPWGPDRWREGPTNDAGRAGVTSLKIGPFTGGGGELPVAGSQRYLTLRAKVTRKSFFKMKIAIYIKQIYLMIYANASRLSTKPATA
jgi:hypothetical protein